MPSYQFFQLRHPPQQLRSHDFPANGDGPPIPATGVLYIQPTPVGIDSKRHQESKWNTGLFGCHGDMKICCKTFFCPCITASEIVEIITEGTTSTREALVILGLFSMTYCMWAYTCFNRTIIRTRFNIKGSPCNDCLAHGFCLPCALCQEYRELDHRGFDPSLGWFENVERQKNAVAIYQITPPEPASMTRS
ncbi:protein PLANT CADMIUM RESISTANCE 2-like [Henckelia pumila]|uniref:protein PLANT CADMIUM RESISTANCE 2-like n=1 Tax=Henckelia pumila TaxID=405737 RepID=UPI003C6E6979